MALNKNLRTTEDARSSGSGSEDEELEKLESNVKEMAHKILEYRSTLPDQLRTTLASVLAAQRPVLPDWLEPGPSGDPYSDAEGQVKSGEGVRQAGEDQEIAEKVQLLKDKISSNISAVPTVLKRMRECISKIDKLDSCSGIIHPAFKRTKSG